MIPKIKILDDKIISLKSKKSKLMDEMDVNWHRGMDIMITSQDRRKISGLNVRPPPGKKIVIEDGIIDIVEE